MHARRFKSALLILVLLAAAGGCSKPLTPQEKLDAASRWSIHLLDQNMASLRKSDAPGKALVIARMQAAKDLLLENPHLPSDAPFLISAYISPRRGVISFQWIQRTYQIQGVYLKDGNGKIIRVADPALTKNTAQPFGADLTFWRTATVAFINAADAGATRTGPTAIFPPGFVEKGMKAGLIESDGQLSDAVLVLSSDIASSIANR